MRAYDHMCSCDLSTGQPKYYVFFNGVEYPNIVSLYSSYVMFEIRLLNTNPKLLNNLKHISNNMFFFML